MAGGYALFAGDQLDFMAAVGRPQPGRLRRTGRAHPHENLKTIADCALERAVADPVAVAQHAAVHPQCLARPYHDAAAGSIEPHHIERRAGSDAQSAALTDGEMNDALMPADGAAVEVDDIAGQNRVGPQPADDVGIAPARHEADVLAVLLVRHGEAEAPRQFARLRLGHSAQWEAPEIRQLP